MALVPWEVGVAGPEAESARSESEAPARLWGVFISAIMNSGMAKVALSFAHQDRSDCAA